jgi:hypothetical protein
VGGQAERRLDLIENNTTCQIFSLAEIQRLAECGKIKTGKPFYTFFFLVVYFLYLLASAAGL